MGSEKDQHLNSLTGDPSKARAVPIHRLHTQAKFNTFGRGFWDTWSPENGSLLLASYCSIAAFSIELTVWLDNWPDNFYGLRVSGSVAGLLLLLALANGWLTDRFLASMTPGKATLPKGARCLRLLIAVVPVLGLHAFTFWKWYLERSQSQYGSTALCLPRQSLDLTRDPSRLSVSTLLRRSYRAAPVFLWSALGILPLIIWAGWLMSAPLGSYRRTVILGSCALLHLTACAFMWHSFGCRIRKVRVTGRQRFLYRIIPFLLLLPAPGVIAGVLLTIGLANPQETLVWKLHARRTGNGRIPLWRSLQSSLRRRWQGLPWFMQWRQPTHLISEMHIGHAEQQVMAFYRLRALLLILEGAASFASLAILAARFPHLKGTLNQVARSATFGAIALAGIGAIIHSSAVLLRLLKISSQGGNLALYPLGRYLMLTQVAFLAGLQGASLVVGGQVAQFGMLLFWVSYLCAVLSILFTLPGIRVGDLLLWAPFFLTLSLLGLLIEIDGRGNQPALEGLRWLTALSPLWSLSLFLALGAWLLRPFSWRHIFDRRLPPRLRAALAFVALTGAIPLGGIAIPFWIYAHHRLWPRYERLLWNLKLS